MEKEPIEGKTMHELSEMYDRECARVERGINDPKERHDTAMYLAAIMREMSRIDRERREMKAEQERLRIEQERQAAILKKHEEQIEKLEQRMVTAENELAFNREQRDRLFLLLDIEERERDAAIPGSKTWQTHHKKVISLENQIHTVQKRIDRYTQDRRFCAEKLKA